MREGFISLVEETRKSLTNDGKILICGNGGSAAQAEHFAAELIGSGLPCISLTSPPIITAIGNDYGFEKAFSYQIAALGKRGDILICLTTLGMSRNILWATATGRRRGMKVFTITGETAPKTVYSRFVRVSSSDIQTIQEETLCILHKLWKELV